MEANHAARSEQRLAALAAALSLLVLTSARAAETETAAASDTDALFALDLEALLQVPVTGSHIARREPGHNGPLSIIDREMIERSGVQSLELLLQRLPQSAGYAGNQSNAYWASNGNGSSHVNLRGLGIYRTLVLINGRRLANGGTGANIAADLNQIPLAVVERIELLKDGASAIYGADAIGGVVNIITRTPQDGVNVQLRYGETSAQDGAERALDLLWGHTGDSGRFQLGLHHWAVEAINMADRAPCGLGESAGELVCVNSGNTIGGRALLADGSRVNFNQIAGGDGDFYEPYNAAVHNFNGNPYLNAVNPIDVTALSALADWQLSARVAGFLNLLYSERDSEQLASPGTIGLNRPIRIAADHPTNPTGQDLVLQRRRLLEAGTRDFFQEVESYWAVAGLDGQFDERWRWQVALNTSRNEAIDGEANIANLDHVDATLDTGVCSNTPGAAIPCADYLGYGDVSAAVLDYILFSEHGTGGNEQQGWSARVNGELRSTAAGRWLLASGVEQRREKGWRHPDETVLTGVANTNLQSNIDGDYTVSEAFIELAVPLLRQVAFAERLELSAAYRYSDYRELGSDGNYKLGLDWQLNPSWQLHASYATSFRAPNIPELFTTVDNGNLNTIDPCSNWSTLPATSVVYQNCLAEGVPAGYRQLTSTILTTRGGNMELDPEAAVTRTLGLLWTPASLPGLSVSLDHYQLDIDDAITAVSGSTKLAACYQSTDRSHPFCGAEHYTRNALSGDIDFLSVRLINAASEDMAVSDLSARYPFALGPWQAGIRVDLSYLHRYELTPYAGAAALDYTGKFVSGRGTYPEWRGWTEFNARLAPWTFGYSIQLIGEVADSGASAGMIGANAPSVDYHNARLAYDVSEQLQLAAGINNLWDTSAPFLRNWLDVNTDTMTYDVAGRRWYLTGSYRF